MYRQLEKNLLSNNISSTCPHSFVNFSPLAAEMVSLVWGTPANFNGFWILSALLHGTLVVGVSQTAALNRGRHLYSAGWPSRWALPRISSVCLNQKVKGAWSKHSEKVYFTVLTLAVKTNTHRRDNDTIFNKLLLVTSLQPLFPQLLQHFRVNCNTSVHF